LRKQLTDQVVAQLQSQVGAGKYVVPTNRTKVTSSKFSAEVGKEINTLSLTLTVEAEALSYSSSELQGLAAQVLTVDVPSGYTLPKESIQVEPQPATTASNSAQVSVTAQLAGVAKANVDPSSWKQEVSGKTEQAALELLRKKPEVASVKLFRQPAFFAQFIKTLPKDQNKIDVQVR
jgi:hypothetical protein